MRDLKKTDPPRERNNITKIKGAILILVILFLSLFIFFSFRLFSCKGSFFNFEVASSLAISATDWFFKFNIEFYELDICLELFSTANLIEASSFLTLLISLLLKLFDGASFNFSL